MSGACSQEENCIRSDVRLSKLYRRRPTSYSAVVARTQKVMYPNLISASANDFCPQLARIGSYERFSCGRLAQGLPVQVRKSGSRLAAAIAKVNRASFFEARKVVRPCRACALTRIVGQLILSSSELAWPRAKGSRYPVDIWGTRQPRTYIQGVCRSELERETN